MNLIKHDSCKIKKKKVYRNQLIVKDIEKMSRDFTLQNGSYLNKEKSKDKKKSDQSVFFKHHRGTALLKKKVK